MEEVTELVLISPFMKHISDRKPVLSQQMLPFEIEEQGEEGALWLAFVSVKRPYSLNE